MGEFTARVGQVVPNSIQPEQDYLNRDLLPVNFDPAPSSFAPFEPKNSPFSFRSSSKRPISRPNWMPFSGSISPIQPRTRTKLRAEVDRRAGGGRGLPTEMLRSLQGLTIACGQAGSEKSALGSSEEDGLAQLDQRPAPFPSFAGFLRELAAGRSTSIPDGLPAELREWLESLAAAR